MLVRLILPVAALLLCSSKLLATTDCAAQTDISQAECEALADLYNSTDGPNWSDSPGNGWNANNSPCSWAGATCSGGTVISISRSQKNLIGDLPDLSVLTNLKLLRLSSNQLSGTIPDLSALTNLQTLHLSNNWFTGGIPDLSALTSLQGLYLDRNYLSGAIPDLSALTNLEVLDLHTNLLNGSIPNLSALTNLRYLSLYSNQLTGSLPDLSALTNLQSFDLYSNQLSGGIPDLSALTNLEYLSLGSNQFTGSIPSLSALIKLQYLCLHSNQLSGIIPGLPDTLLYGSFAYNGFTGETNGEATALDSDWAETQTIAPPGLSSATLSSTSIRLDWTPIAYTADGGDYRVKYATASGGPWIEARTTAGKTASSYTVTELSPDTDYWFVLETYTPVHTNNENAITSEFSTEVSARTLPVYAPTLHTAGTGSGTVSSIPAPPP